MVDKIFKIGILVVLIIFLLLYSQKDRYTEFDVGWILDSHTGKVYFSNGMIYYDPVKESEK